MRAATWLPCLQLQALKFGNRVISRNTEHTGLFIHLTCSSWLLLTHLFRRQLSILNELKIIVNYFAASIDEARVRKWPHTPRERWRCVGINKVATKSTSTYHKVQTYWFRIFTPIHQIVIYNFVRNICFNITLDGSYCILFGLIVKNNTLGRYQQN